MKHDTNERNAIAIVGLAGRFPGAPDVDAFWSMIRDGRSAIRRLTDEELAEAGVSPATSARADYVPFAPVLDHIDAFDASFFGLNPREASVMDPAHRIFLEIAWHAFEHAGYSALPDEGTVAVFATSGAPLYLSKNVETNPEIVRSMGEFLVRHTGNDMNFLSTRVSYHMDLRGPSLNVQTACSSALVAVHLACESLLKGDCDMALAGGATVLVPQKEGYTYRDGEILSPDGQCRPFDAASAGTVFGSGAGAIVLKRLSDALDHGDTIHAVIKGSAMNNDGAAKVGYLAPGVDGQVRVIQAALKASGVDASTISYVEAHGTGTRVGDPIEAEAIVSALGAGAAGCGIGSVKSNIGHLGEAAGIASLIKTVMALKHRALPPSLGFKSLNPAIAFDDTRFYINASLQDWRSEAPLRCGVTALGAGGTNCHVVLEEAPSALQGEGARAETLFVLSAKTQTALSAAAQNLGQHVRSLDPETLADSAYTLASGRRALPHRRMVVANSPAQAAARLSGMETRHVFSAETAQSNLPVVFMFPGGGAQYAGMAADLYTNEPVFAEAVDACLAIIEPAIGRALRPLMFPAPANLASATRTLEQPSLTLPALFTIEYALTQLFEHWGVSPSASIGHSVGEYVAATHSGVMSLPDALKLVMLRGRLFERTEPGSMIAVALSEKELRARLPDRVSIAAINAPDLVVASGPVAAVRALQMALEQDGINVTPIRIDVAAHSTLLDPILAEFRATCRSVRLSPPTRPFISNVTGDWIKPNQATDPEYWVTHLRSPVRFADGLETLRRQGPCALLEVGPGRTLTMLAKAQAQPFAHAFNCMRHPQENDSDLACALAAIGRLWTVGASIDWSAFYQDQLRNRVPLPQYAFDRQSYWIAPGKSKAHAAGNALDHRVSPDDWFSTLSFIDAPLIESASSPQPQTWLIISEKPAPARALAAAMKARKIIIASHAAERAFDHPARWTLDFNTPHHFESLLDAFEARYGAPDRIVFLAARDDRFGAFSADKAQARHCLHPLHLLQALGARSEDADVTFVTHGLCDADGQALVAEHALILGPAFVAPRELPNVKVRCIDMPAPNTLAARRAQASLVRELRASVSDTLVALRDGQRLKRIVSPLALPNDALDSSDWIRENGVYVITGGLGGIGLEIATHMAREKKVRLVLLSRTGLPEGEAAGLIRAQKTPTSLYDRLTRIDAMRAQGSDVLSLACDVSDEASLARALGQARSAFGPIHGVLHAAGVIDDAPLMSKTQDDVLKVLGPKVGGTRALDKLIREDLDVFIVFSSVASFLGLPGQADYAAANAYLDAFAKARAKRSAGRTLVINWSAWAETGMAQNEVRRQKLGADATHPCAFAGFEGYRTDGEARIYSATFEPREHWLFTEHQIKDGPALLPGTALVEFARAAVADFAQCETVELNDLTMIAPFVSDGEPAQRLNIRVTPSDNGYEIWMGAGAGTLPLVTGSARAVRTSSPRRIDLSAIAARCTTERRTPTDRFLEQSFMTFGPRWANIQSVKICEGEALLDLALAPAFQSDLNTYALHPALLDMATGGVQSLIAGFDAACDFYVPVAYEKLTVHGRMPAHLFSHVRYEGDAGDGFARFDVTLSDEAGNVFAEIAHFTMKRLDAQSDFRSTPPRVGATRLVDAHLQNAILPPEGLAALNRVLAQPRVTQIAISAVDVNAWLKSLESSTKASAADETLTAFERPAAARTFAEPQTETETVLASLWSTLLGIRQIGRHDDFFDLGGNSLVGVRLFASIKKQFGAQLPMSILFEAPTIAQLAERLGDSDTPRAEVPKTSSQNSPLVCIQPGAPHRRPIFCVHGGLGNVVGFKPIADHLGREQPFYGLQAQGIDGQSPPLTDIAEMARLYISAIRTRQLRGPYVLAGYSGGGVIAQEMVRQFAEAGDGTDLLIFIDTLEPSQAAKPITHMDRARQLVQLRPKQFLRMLNRRWQSQHEKQIDEAPTLTPLETASRAVETAYLHAQDRHTPLPVTCPVLIIRASQARMHFLRAGRLLGWAPFLRGPVEVCGIDANHETICFEPAVADVARAMSEALIKFGSAPPAASAEPQNWFLSRAS